VKGPDTIDFQPKVDSVWAFHPYLQAPNLWAV